MSAPEPNNYGATAVSTEQQQGVEEQGVGERRIDEEVEEDQRHWFFRHSTAIAHIWGVLTLVGLWYCTVDLLKNRNDHTYTPYYTLVAAIIVSFFEFVWFMNKIVCCKDNGQCCCALWRIIVWVDNWKKGVLYCLVSIPEFLKGWHSSLAVIAGILIVLLAVVYFLKSFKSCSCIANKKKKKEAKIREDPEAALLKNDAPSPPPEPQRNEADERWQSIVQTSEPENEEGDGEDKKESIN
ncbi:hypothetical protein CAPTEDRAFT_225987 [Capitella teleta]|uniref:Transmembrane protein n=1 Tax=Capitella teleta TaxID=283909 RepID=R7UK56_CAPTE|nr:hypothetical protein CAPTEDRAFT_225987 [Capitella teleta]|eukprot:ELU04188.1 hypothetical protein CAPTEDRAFT_225987 [Capitella teleta]